MEIVVSCQIFRNKKKKKKKKKKNQQMEGCKQVLLW